MSDWKHSFEELKAYIVKNPGIELTPNIICIPADVREEFYRLFDTVRLTIINDHFPGMLEEGKRLSQQWAIAVAAAVERFNLKGVEMDSDTTWFLQDPTDGLFRLLFDPLFDVIRGKKNLEAFEASLAKILSKNFSKFMLEGYQAWVTLSVLNGLSVDGLYTVKPSELDIDPSLHVEMAVPGLQEDTPEMEKAKTVSFRPTLRFSFMVPNVIGHMPQPDEYVAFVPNFEYNEAKWLGKNLDFKRTWVKFTDIYNEFGQTDLYPNVALYIGEHWKNVIVASDAAEMARPEIIVELRAENGWYEREGLQSIRRHYDVMKPKSGSFVICLHDVPEGAVKELEPVVEVQAAAQEAPKFTGAEKVTRGEVQGIGEALPVSAPQPQNIHLLNVGFDPEKLLPLREAISGKPEGA